MGKPIATPLWSSIRFQLAIFAFFGFLNFYALKVNMSIAIVCMINHTAVYVLDNTTWDGANSSAHFSVKEEKSCQSSETIKYGLPNSSYPYIKDEGGSLEWDKPTQGLILGSMFWGYVLTNVAGGILATKFGGKCVIGFSLLFAAILTLLVPAVARANVYGLMALRFFTGMSQGFVSPAMQSFWSFWAPPLESSRLRSICFAGSQVGKVLTFPITALLCEYGFDGGWPSIFYLQGAFGVLWFIAWQLCVHDTPSSHPRISVAEREYIEDSLHGRMPTQLRGKTRTPWKEILCSLRVWAIIVAHTCSNWGEYTFLTNIPTYMEEVLHFNIKKNGFLSAVPYIFLWVVIGGSSWLADLVQSKQLLSTFRTRQVFNCLGAVVPAILLVGLSYLTCEHSVTAVVLLTLGVGFTGCQYGGGLYLNAGDIAPQYAGVIYGISNTVATIPGFLAPLSIGLITKDKTQEQWQTVFFISTAIYLFGAIVFFVMGSGDLQPWAMAVYEENIEADVPNGKALIDNPDRDNNGHVAMTEKPEEFETENCDEVKVQLHEGPKQNGDKILSNALTLKEGEMLLSETASV